MEGSVSWPGRPPLKALASLQLKFYALNCARASLLPASITRVSGLPPRPPATASVDDHAAEFAYRVGLRLAPGRRAGMAEQPLPFLGRYQLEDDLVAVGLVAVPVAHVGRADDDVVGHGQDLVGEGPQGAVGDSRQSGTTRRPIGHPTLAR